MGDHKNLPAHQIAYRRFEAPALSGPSSLPNQDRFAPGCETVKSSELDSRKASTRWAALWSTAMQLEKFSMRYAL